MATAGEARKDFYEHKHLLHDGAYDKRCEVCRELWQAFVAASKVKAGVT